MRPSRRKASGDTPRSRGYLLRGLGYLRQHKSITIAAYFSLLISTAGTLVVPLLIQYIIDNGLNPTNPAQSDEQLVIQFSVLMVVLAAFAGIFTFFQGYLAEKVSQNVAYDMRNELYEKIQRLSFSYHDRSQTGQLMTRATSDVERLRMFLGQGFLLLINSFLLITGIVTVMFILNWQLTLVILPLLVIMTALFAVFGRRAQPLFRQMQEKMAAFNTILQENLSGIRVVKAFVREKYEHDRFQESNINLMNASLRTTRVMATLFPTAMLVSGISLVAVVWVGGFLAVEGNLQLGELTAFSSYLALLMVPVAQLGFIVAAASQASASAGRIFEITDTRNEIEDKSGARSLDTIEGRVQFDNVSFRYFKSSAYVLSTVNFTAEPGQTIALLGATGSGKSTIINLIPRFYDPSEGCILIDGQDIRDVKLESLRRQIGIVLQETNLFTGTIRDNIAYGRTDATEQEIENAARAAAAHDFIMEFPNGYDTAVGERGFTLSGGQKQRIAIARALILDPQILILDDSTSSVDYKTESEIQQALDKLMEGRTSFVIAQRISTVRNADKILVLDEGHLVAEGTHDALMESSPIYAEIFYSQLMEDDTPGESGGTPVPEPGLVKEG
jgi:ATP-binding cassette subfamily B protein